MTIPVQLLSATETVTTSISFGDICDFLTVIVAFTTVIVSVLALSRSYKASQRTAYLEKITTSRERWQISLRESSAKYFAQLLRVCSPHEENFYEAFIQLAQYHYEMRLHFFKCDGSTIARMEEILDYASKIVQVRAKLADLGKLSKDDITQLQCQLDSSIRCVMECKKPELVQDIAWYIEIEWRKQMEESTVFWGKGIDEKRKEIRNRVYRNFPRNP